MRTALIVAGLVVSLAAQAQDIYRWVDKDGIVHYADQPGSPDAVLIPNPAIGYAPPDDAETPQLYEPERRNEPRAGPSYQSLQILSPAQDEVFYGGDVSVFVQLQLDGELRPGDGVAIFLDGQKVSDAEGLSATLTGLTRGTHTVRATVSDQNGSAVISSPQVTFHLRQATIATPPTGPGVAPRPRPPTAPPRPTPLPAR